jgi:DNA polymerase-3 subunit beta
MKLSCPTSELLEALQLVSRAIGSQQALPILGNILFQAKGDTCTVSATDLELSIITHFKASIETEGSITIPAKAILNFVQYNQDSDILLDVHEGTQLKCSSKRAKATIAGEAASEYPTITSVQEQTTLTLPIDPFLRSLHLVTFASAKTSLRPVLSGVFVRSEKGDLILVATDIYRLSEYMITGVGGSTDISCIIPVKILEELKVVLGGKKSDKKEKDDGAEKKMVTIGLSKQQIEVRVGNVQLVSRLIDGKFPNYQQIIPKETPTRVSFATDELTTAVKRMHYFAKEVNNNLTFHCTQGETKITTPQTQTGRDEASLQTELSGSENKIALSSAFLLDFLGHVGSDVVVLQMQDSQHPAVFRSPVEEKYLHLIMPLRMQE